MDRLFVYGTLAPGKPNHNVLESIPGTWEKASIRGKLVDEGWGAEMGCPGIIPSDEGDQVEGFIFSSETLAEHWLMLDDFEGAGYERKNVIALRHNGEQLSVQVYALKTE